MAERIIDSRRSNLQVVNYIAPVSHESVTHKAAMDYSSMGCASKGKSVRAEPDVWTSQA